MTFVFLLIIIVLTLSAFYFVIKKRVHMVFFVYLIFLPVYITFLSIVYKFTANEFLIQILQLIKQILLFVVPITIFFYGIYNRRLKFILNALDKWFLIFIGLNIIFLVIPLGANFGAKVGAFRNFIGIGLAYMCGRMTNFSNKNLINVFKILAILAVSSGTIAVFEFILQHNIQQDTGYSAFMTKFYNADISGYNDLSWTFTTEQGIRRFASFFADPLEYSASMLFVLPAILIIIKNKSIVINRNFYTTALVIGFFGFLVTVSRASLVSFVIELIFIYYFLSKNKLHFIKFVSVLAIIAIAVSFIISDKIVEMIVDTISFNNSSSVGHLIEWTNGIVSVIKHPIGIGLGMSGNVASQFGVESVGGENQFLIIAVQIGVQGLILYLGMIYNTISTSINVFKQHSNYLISSLALLVAITKIGLLIPAFSANAELYSFVSYCTWWLAGYISTQNNNLRSFSKLCIPIK